MRVVANHSNSISWPASPTEFVGSEAALLIRSIQVEVEPKSLQLVKTLLARSINWTFLLRIAYEQGTMPLLYWQLSSSCPDLVPRAILSQLRKHHRNNVRRNFVLFGELYALLRLFDAHGIRAIPFKGLTLAACAYGDLALRDIRDLDLLIPKRDVAKATEVLLDRGYQLNLAASEEKALLASDGQLPFGPKRGAAIIELHTALMPRYLSFGLDFERVWERRITLPLGGQCVPSLCLEDLLLVLCVHGTKHDWESLKWICDIAHLLHRHPEMNWDGVLKEAHRLGCERMLFLGLFLARDLLHAPIPQEVWARNQSVATVTTLGRQVTRNLFRPLPQRGVGLQSSLFHLKVRERLRDGVRFCISVALAPTEADRELVKLPSFLHCLYYLLRPLRLTGNYGQRLFSYFRVGNR